MDGPSIQQTAETVEAVSVIIKHAVISEASNWPVIMTCVAGFLSAGIMFWALRVAVHHLMEVKKASQEELDAQRRRAAHQIVSDWTKLNSMEKLGVVLKIQQSLEKSKLKQIERLSDSDKVSIPENVVPLFTTCLCTNQGNCETPCCKCKHLFTDEGYLTMHAKILFRRHVGMYFNSLEVVFLARYHGIADKKILDEEFSFVIKEEPPESDLLSFEELLRIADARERHFPCLWDYIKTTKWPTRDIRDVPGEN